MGASSHQALVDVAWLITSSTAADLIFTEPMLGDNFSSFLAVLLSGTRTRGVAATLGLDLLFSMIFGLDALPTLSLASSSLFAQMAHHHDLAAVHVAWLQTQLSFFLSHASLGDSLATVSSAMPL